MVFKHSEQEAKQADKGVIRKILAHSKNLMCVEVILDQDREVPEHSHVHEQVSYVKSGKFQFTIDGKVHILGEGDSVYLASNIPHTAKCLEKGVLLDIFTPQREDFL